MASAQRKNRPESSSPEKLKLRNPQKATGSGKSNDVGADDDEDNYSDEEIANDPDDDDDDTNKLMRVGGPKDADSEDEEQYLDEYEKIQRETDKGVKKDAADGDDDYENDDNEFEESPRQKVGSQGALSGQRTDEEPMDGEGEDALLDDEDVDEDEVIDVAERIFVRIAEAIIEQERRSIREVFAD